MSKDALFWEPSENGGVKCRLCPHLCVIRDGASGYCGVRGNAGGKLYASMYGYVSAIALDPIEKKPLRRFRSGSRILSIGGVGCNFRCPFCQNSGISAEYNERACQTFAPNDVLVMAKRTEEDGNIGVAYTYNEPLIGYEFVLDCAKLIREAGLCNVLVTNGYISRQPLTELLPFIDAMNIDLKGFNDGFYRKLGGCLDAVKETITLCAEHCHVEVTTLVIPGENEDDVGALSEWLASVNPEIPLHLSRFFPRYKYSGKEATSRETIERLCLTARKHLKYVYMGNV